MSVFAPRGVVTRHRSSRPIHEYPKRLICDRRRQDYIVEATVNCPEMGGDLAKGFLRGIDPAAERLDHGFTFGYRLGNVP